MSAENSSAPGSTAQARSWDSWFTCGRTVLLLLAFVAVAYPEVFRGTHTFFYRDFGSFAYPLAHYLRESFWRGEVPLWNPMSECGVPFAAQWAPMVFYPGSLLLMFAPLRWSLVFFSIAHLLLAGAGMYALAHRWTGHRLAASFAALTYAANGMLMHSLTWPHYMAAFAWMPLVVLWTERAVREGRRALLIASLVGAMQMLSGAPEPILFTWLAILAWLAPLLGKDGTTLKQLIFRLSAVIALVAALAAVQLLPFFDLLLHSGRYEEAERSRWTLPLWGYANYLVPMFHAIAGRIGVYTQQAQQFVTSYYLGTGTIVLALWCAARIRERQVWALLFVIFVGLAFAPGEQSPVYWIFQKVIPALSWSRYSVKWLILVTFALPLLAARALAEWQKDSSSAETQSATALVKWIGGCLLALMAWIVFCAFRAPVKFESPQFTFDNAALRAIMLVATLVVLVRGLRVRVSGALAVLLLVITAADLITHTPRQNPLVLTEAYEPIELNFPVRPQPGESRAMMTAELRTALAYPLLEDSLSFYFTLRRAGMPNCNLIDEVPILSGFWPLSLRGFCGISELFYPTSDMLPATNTVPAGLADFLGISVLSSLDIPCEWRERLSAMPLVAGGQQPVFASVQETLRAIASTEFDPRRIVYLPETERGQIRIAPDAIVKVQRGRTTAHEWDFSLEASAPALVTISQSFYHPWTAWVDGHPQRLLRANYAFQALEVGAGKHVVKLRYIDWAFRIGAVVSLTAVAIVVVLWFRFRSKAT